jgi:hypothetical protein
MSRPRIAAPTSGAALLALLFLLLPTVSLALPAGTPPISPATRAALSNAAEGHALLPWQRQFMRGLAARPAAPANATGAGGSDGAWSELPPPSLEEAPAVYDPVRQSMLLFGASDPSGASTADVWELSLSGSPTWTLLLTAGTKPPPRSGHVLLYDSRRERLLLFGGADSITRNDSWALDLTVVPPAWGQGLPTGTLPSRRAYCQAVYDSLNDRAVLFGGADSLTQEGPPIGIRADVWVLPFTGPFAWTELTPTGTPPSPRAGGAVIYDRARQRMVLFGGYDGNVLDDGFTLSLDASPAWAALGASGGPPAARAIPGVIYEAPEDRMVIFGGFTEGTLNDVWALDLATPAWTQLSPTGGPPSARQFPAAVYDAPRDRMVVFGGNDTTSAVQDPLWSLSLGSTIAWTDLGGRRPPTRWDAATAFDLTRRVMWIHGGDAYGNNGRATRSDLWSLAVGSSMEWSQPATTGTPLGRRFGHSAFYDAPRDRLVFFGGSDTLTHLNDVWALTLSGTPAWNQLSPTGTPPVGRKYHSAVYDALNNRMVVFGGNTGMTTLNDVWALSLAGAPAWTELFPTGTPPPSLWGQSAALDREANRLIIFGGQATGRRNNVHALTLTGSPAWIELFPTGTPPDPRESASMVSLGTRMLVFGGNVDDFGVATNDTWLLSLHPTPSWRQLDVGSPVPTARFGSSAVFDDLTFRLVIFGGTSFSTEGGDTWVLQVDQLVPTLASLVSANAKPDRVDLAWEIASSVASARVYRSAGGGSWTELGRVVPDGTGRLAYADLDVIAGARYGYRLGLLEYGGEVFAGEVWVDVPVTARFALRGMAPNPSSVGAGLVTFSLPDASPARLEVLDVSGRQVFSREVGGLGGGEHFVRVSGAEPLAPGVYLVRLTRGGRSLTAKAVTIR